MLKVSRFWLPESRNCNHANPTIVRGWIFPKRLSHPPFIDIYSLYPQQSLSWATRGWRLVTKYKHAGLILNTFSIVEPPDSLSYSVVPDKDNVTICFLYEKLIYYIA